MTARERNRSPRVIVSMSVRKETEEMTMNRGRSLRRLLEVGVTAAVLAVFAPGVARAATVESQQHSQPGNVHQVAPQAPQARPVPEGRHSERAQARDRDWHDGRHGHDRDFHDRGYAWGRPSWDGPAWGWEQPYVAPPAPAPVYVPAQWVWNGWGWVWQPGYWSY